MKITNLHIAPTDEALLAQVRAELASRPIHLVIQPTRLDRIFEICDRVVPERRSA